MIAQRQAKAVAMTESEPLRPRQSALQATRPVKRSFSLAGHRTSISLETAFWDALREAAKAEGITLAALVVQIDRERGGAGLSGAVRVWVLDYWRGRALGGGKAEPVAAPTVVR